MREYIAIMNNFDDLKDIDTLDQQTKLLQLIALAIDLEELDHQQKINKPEFHYLKCKILQEVFLQSKQILEEENESDELQTFIKNLRVLKETTYKYFEEYPDNRWYKELKKVIDDLIN